MTETASVATRLLTGAQREAFRHRGDLFPLWALSPAAVRAARAHLEAFRRARTVDGPERGTRILGRAVDWNTPGAAKG